MDPPPYRASAARFPTTHWSRVVAAGGRATPDCREALTEPCRVYWYPLYAFIRRKGFRPDDAQDLTQSYFARLLQTKVLAAVDREKGRFRAFLRTDCGYFLADQRDRENALKRGGGIAPVSIDVCDAEGRYQVEPADLLTPERLFDRTWALTLLDGVLDRLAREYTGSGRAELFEQLKVVLTDGPRSVSYARIATRLGMSEGAIQSAVQRVRRRYRDLLREGISATLGDPSPAEVEDEIRALFAALKR
jgi:DNA-directed RNA polymerase specialized sigma24 family protein